MNACKIAVDLVAEFEGFSAEPYKCPADVWTIGYGSTRTPDGKPVTEKTPPITKAEARDWLDRDLAKFEDQVTGAVKVPLTTNQLEALVSFTYNVGIGHLRSSTLLRKLNEEDYEGAAQEFPKWRKAGGKVLAGLERRRAAERELFET